MRVLIMGSGTVGGYFGGRLAAAGHDVAFMARGRTLEALRSRGLEIRSPEGDVRLESVRAVAAPEEAGPVDVVLLTVKMYDLAAACDALRPSVVDRAMIVTTQNGVESPAVVGAALGEEKVVPGAAYFMADMPEPALIRHHVSSRLVFGEVDGRRSERCRDLAEALNGAGCDAHVSARIEGELWDKFVLLATFSGMTAATRLSAGPIRSDSDIRALYEAAVREVIAVAEAREVAVSPDQFEKTMAMLDKPPPQVTSSMLQDLMQGKRLELPWLSGAVMRLGRESGVPVPIHSCLYGILKPYVDGPPPTWG
jgi:2-dehydropantoate 2-reductase